MVSAPTPGRDELESANLVQFDPDSLMDPKAMFMTDVPCTFCNQTVTLLLEMCKDFGGHSVDHVEEFLTRCTELGGMNDLDRLIEGENCSPEEKRVKVIYIRRMRCAKVFRGLVRMYDPYDPCTQIRTDYQRNPRTVCESGDIDCHDAPPSKLSNKFVPPYETNASMPFQPPPLHCSQYVAKVVSECSRLKADDFYARSNLDGWCHGHYNGTYQAIGCEKVVKGMATRNSFMDMCSGLKVLPIDKRAKGHKSFCESFLQLHPHEPVPVLEYTQYMALVEQTHKVDHYKEMLNKTQTVPRDVVVLLP